MLKVNLSPTLYYGSGAGDSELDTGRNCILSQAPSAPASNKAKPKTMRFDILPPLYLANAAG